jgi:hypothetical protein
MTADPTKFIRTFSKPTSFVKSPAYKRPLAHAQNHQFVSLSAENKTI